MRKVVVFAALVMLFAITATAQTTDTSKSKVSENKKIIDSLVFKMYGAESGKKAEELATEILKNIDTNPIWQSEKSRRELYRMFPLYIYLETEDFDGFKDLRARLGEVKGTDRIHLATAGYVRRVTAKGIDLDYARHLIQNEREWARQAMLDTLTSKTFNGNARGRIFTYALFTTDYAKLLARKGERQHAFELMKEAMEYNRRERKDAEITDYYLSVAAEFLDQKDLKKEMEALIKDGMSTAGAIERLKTIYAKEKGSEKGFENYIASFTREHVNEKMEELRKTMLNQAAPAFVLKDLKGKEVSLKSLKGKTVVLDFWATWCGPCVAAFPAMQAMVNRYKDDPNVQFLFVNTLENIKNREKTVKEFIENRKHNFDVLLDNMNEATKQFELAKQLNINSIPAKFVIDKNGVLRFRSIGFPGDAALMDEIEAMIKLAN
jgi:peroxiredoxin